MATKKEAAAKKPAAVKEAAPKKPAAAKAEAAPKAEAAFDPKKLSIKIDAPKAAIEKLITSIKTRGTKLQIDLHSAACASLNHASLHNDPTLLNRLITALPVGLRKNSLIVWALEFGNLALNEDKKKAESMPLVYLKEKKADIDGAIAKPFWEYRNVREGGPTFVFQDFIGSFKDKLRKQIDKLPEVDRRKALAILHAVENTEEAFTANAPATPTAPAAQGKTLAVTHPAAGEKFDPAKHSERRVANMKPDTERRAAAAALNDKVH